MIDILVDEEVDRTGLPDEGRMRQAVAAACAQAGVSRRVTLCLRIAGDKVVRELNRKWRHANETTDVLSFPMQEGPDYNLDEPLGDLILAWPFIRRQARRLGLTADAHALHLIVHGVLHLLGHNHRDAAESRRMRCMEGRAMRALGLHDPYEDVKTHA